MRAETSSWCSPSLVLSVLKKAIKVGEWNTTEVVSQNGMLTSKINGIEVSSGKGELTVVRCLPFPFLS